MSFRTSLGNIDLIIFDLDGTLVDTKDDIVAAFEWTLAKNNIEAVRPDQIAAHVGTGVQTFLIECLLRNPEIDLKKALDEFSTYYRANFTVKSRLYPDVLKVLEHCELVPLVVLTNKSGAFARPLLESLGIADRFAEIYATEAFERTKPDPLPIRRVCEKFGVLPDRVLIVGDTPTDIDCGRNAGAKTCAARYGYAPPAALSKCAPDWTIDSLISITTILERASPNPAARLAKLLTQASRRIIGLMSGMSKLRHRLLAGRDANSREISELNVLVGEAFARCVEHYFGVSGVNRSSVDAIGSHGQTLFHSTQYGDLNSTLQVGSPSIIAERTGIPTIGNFRVRDVAAGGQGAPLVALADFLLFREERGPVALHNLGSISNISVVTHRLEDALSFDSGPANIAIDYFARLLPNNSEGIDAGGKVSQTGQSIPELLELWMSEPFFKLQPPKAAGYCDFSLFKNADLSEYEIKDLLRTAVEWTAKTIEDAYLRFVFPRYPHLKKVTFSGGGVYNGVLMNRIRALLPELEFKIMEKTFSDAKEALAFAILANQTLSGRHGSFPWTTGVKRPTILGEIAL